MSQAVLPKPAKTANRGFEADSFSRSVVLLGFLIVAQRGIGFLRSFYVCGALSPAEVGQWDLSFSFLTMVAPLAVLGIPGSFGRYLARHESSGQSGRFLRQTLIVCLGLVAVTVSVLYWARHTVAVYFFGSSEFSTWVGILATGLPLVVFFNFATSWFTGKRLNRIVFRTQFTQTVTFAVGCVVALGLYAVSATAVVIAYLISCMAGLLVAVIYFLGSGEPTSETEPPKPLPIWSKILPFAAWVWASNAILNLFSLCDRMLLVNFHPDPAIDVRYLIGQYHTACLFPLLLLSFGAMAGSMLMPYLSKDWEAENQANVHDRLNLMLKAIGGLCLVGSIGVMAIAPLLFGGIWQDKFSMGESLLPMTLCYCSLAAVYLVAQKYFWCIEKAWFSSLLLGTGLVANFLLGVVFIGAYGIEGVVASTLVAHVFVLASVLLLCYRNGLRFDVGVWLIAFSLISICMGMIPTFACTLILILAVCFTESIVTRETRKLGIDRVTRVLHRLRGVAQ